jgi:O-antigen/teichoic acid export membrane protein
VLLSYLLPLEQFGYYMLAWTLASLIYRLSGPLFNSVLPRMMQLDARGDAQSSQALFRTSGQVMAVLVVPFSLFLATYSEEIMRLWTGDPDLARAVRWVVALMAVGTMMSGMMYVPFAVHLAAGRLRPLLLFYLAAVALTAPLILPLATRAGIVGASASWTIVNLGLSGAMFWLTQAHFGRRPAVRWAVESLAVPVAVSVAFLVAAKGVMGDEPISRLPLLLELAAVGLSCEIIAVLAAPIVRTRILSDWASFRSRE